MSALVKRIFCASCVFLTILAGCSAAEVEVLPPEAVAVPVVEAVVLSVYSPEAEKIMNETPDGTRALISHEMTVKYTERDGFSEEDAARMAEAFFAAMDSVVGYRIGDVTYRDEKTAYVDVYVSSYSRADFEADCRVTLTKLAPEGFNDRPAEERNRLAADAFIAVCDELAAEGKDGASRETRVRVKLLMAGKSGWRIDDVSNFTLKLLGAYLGG